MLIGKLKGEKLKAYNIVFIDRKTGEQAKGTSIIHLFPNEVIPKQVEYSTVKTIVLFKEVI